METSLSNLQFSDSTTLTVTEGKCPVCWQNNKIRKVIPVYYKMREAIYTCEDVNCLYFVSDDFGNLQKFTKANGSLIHSGNVTIPSSKFSHPNEHNVPNGISHSQSALTQANEIVDSSSYLDDLFNSEPSNDDVESLMNELSNFLDKNDTKK